MRIRHSYEEWENSVPADSLSEGKSALGGNIEMELTAYGSSDNQEVSHTYDRHYDYEQTFRICKQRFHLLIIRNCRAPIEPVTLSSKIFSFQEK